MFRLLSSCYCSERPVCFRRTAPKDQLVTTLQGCFDQDWRRPRDGPLYFQDSKGKRGQKEYRLCYSRGVGWRSQASSADRVSDERLPNLRSVRSRRSLSTRSVVSLTIQKMPPTWPLSSLTGS